MLSAASSGAPLVAAPKPPERVWACDGCRAQGSGRRLGHRTSRGGTHDPGGNQARRAQEPAGREQDRAARGDRRAQRRRRRGVPRAVPSRRQAARLSGRDRGRRRPLPLPRRHRAHLSRRVGRARRRDRGGRARRDALHLAREPGIGLGAGRARRRDRALRPRPDRRVLEPAGRDPRGRLVAFPAMDAEILAAVAAEEASMAELLEELVAAPTLLGDEAAGQAIMRRAFVGLGLEPFDVPLDRAALDGQPGAAPFSWDVAGKSNVLANWEPAAPAGGRSLVLNGHIDVVSPEPRSLWTGSPFAARREGDWIYGRGAGDMKSGLAAIVGAVRGLRRLGLAPRGRVQLQSVVEEECTGNGALACVLAGHTADAAILTEPTRGAVWNAQVGVLWFQVRVVGAPAHAGDAPEGANAIEASMAVIEALRGLESELNVGKPPLYAAYPHPINLNVGMIRGGDWPSTVAGECLTHFRLALFPGERVADLKERVEETVAGVAEARPALSAYRIEVRYDGFACEGYELEPDAPLVTGLLDACERATDRRPPLFASTATTDARSFQLYGDTPAVCFGPVAEREHGVDERVLLPSIVETAQAIALFIGDWCGLARTS